MVKFSTKAIHVGGEPDPATGAIITPVFQTSTYVQEGIGKHKGYEYSRTGNPTRAALEACIASLEGGKYGLAFSSGSGAMATVMNLLNAGDHVVVGEDVYGGTYRLFTKVLSRYNLEFTFVDSRDPKAVEAAIKPNTKILWMETPTNPLLNLADLQMLTQLAKSRKLISVVDNTFASPFFQQPLALGADIVVHSTTKYMGGHSDVVGGAVVTSNEEYYERIKFHQNAVGAIPGPFDCWLVQRGLKTLAVRMREHEKNAMMVAKFLEGHPAIEKTIYPGLPSHPQHDLAKRQMSGFSGMVSCVIKGGMEKADIFMQNTKLFALAESLGGVESLLCHPASMTHGSIPKAERDARGIVEGMVRLSCGIEDGDDLVADLEQALSKISSSSTAKVGSR
ncbi:MAG: cystathionine gamma-synthase [Candidatus Obscuribacterales bacterium]|nr:cystathionine gamma-synthase [Candidatus Obscuribacterales bacterium]